MPKKFLKCGKCRYAFQVRQSEGVQNIICPYCGKSNPTETFEQLTEMEFGNGYKISLNEFKHVLKDASKYMIRAFFRKNIDIFTVDISKKGYVFKDNEGIERTVEEVHFLIQTDIVLQRKFYDIYADLYR